MWMFVFLLVTIGCVSHPVVSYAGETVPSMVGQHDIMTGSSTPKPKGKRTKGAKRGAAGEEDDSFNIDKSGLDDATKDLAGGLITVIQSAGALIVLFGLYKLAHGLMSNEARDLSVSSGIILVGVVLSKIDIVIKTFQDESGGSIGDIKDYLTTILFWVGAAAILFGCFEIVKGLIRKDASTFLRSGTIIGAGAICCLSKGIVNALTKKAANETTFDAVVKNFGEILGMLCSVFFWAGAAAIVIGVMHLISGVIKKDPNGYEQSGYIIGAGAIACAIKGVSLLIVEWA